eukprot:SAG31_NODE_1669_length_7575_cov_2.213483_2_plen_299_part_00
MKRYYYPGKCFYFLNSMWTYRLSTVQLPGPAAGRPAAAFQRSGVCSRCSEAWGLGALSRHSAQRARTMPGAHLLVAALMPVAAVSADIVPRTTQPPPSPRRSLDDQIRASCQSHSDFDGGSLLDISKRMFPDTAKLSPGCAAAVTTLQTHAATYDYAFPLSVMICSLGLFPGDTGDYYMCSQAVYGTDPKSTGDGRIRWAVRDAKYLSIPQNTSEYLRTPQQQACRGLLRARHNTQAGNLDPYACGLRGWTGVFCFPLLTLWLYNRAGKECRVLVLAARARFDGRSSSAAAAASPPRR